MRAIQVLIAVALAACGGEAYDLTPDAAPSNERPLYVENGEVVTGEGTIEVEQAESSGDIGQSEQPLIFPKNGAGNPGIQPGSYQTCIQGNVNQNCVVPDHPTLVWFLYDGTNAQKTEIRTHVNQWITDMRNMGLDECSAQRCWKFREAADLSDPDLDLVIAISQSSSGSCPGSIGSTRDLICWGGSTTSVAKASGEGLYGTYHRFADHIVPVATIDYTQIQNTLGLTTNQKYLRARQATRAILLGYGGKGLAIIGNSRCNNTDLLPPSEMCVEAESEVCWFENFGDAGNPDTIHRIGPQCGS